MICNRHFCKRKAYKAFGQWVLCRKHEQAFQDFRRDDLRARNIDPIGHQPTATDLHRWVYELAIDFAA